MKQRDHVLIAMLLRKLDQNTRETLEWFAYEHTFLFPDEVIEKPTRSQYELGKEAEYILYTIYRILKGETANVES